MTDAQKKYLFSNLNSLSTSVYFEEGKDGKIQMVESVREEEQFKKAKELLTDVFSDSNHEIQFMYGEPYHSPDTYNRNKTKSNIFFNSMLTSKISAHFKVDENGKEEMLSRPKDGIVTRINSF